MPSVRPKEPYAAIVAGGRGPLPRRYRAASLVVCADGGVARAHRAGWRPHVVVGDWDSLDLGLVNWLEQVGAERFRYPEAKDKTDSELAVDVVAERGFRTAYLLGGIGKRVDHELANLLLPRYAADRGVDLRVVAGGTLVQLVRGRVELDARVGDWVSLFSLRPHSSGIHTGGLRFALVDGTLTLGSTLGVSNEVTEEPAWVAVSEGELLAVRVRRPRPRA
ncbi:MAG: thiamine diphosphokinase [Armatimonadota bacterium]|nr:thiamine diphosphokinase [Armatimonadota bacterium]MDR7429364.1 thiamine diphosphokinase [Armatimonadota bacterium]MDR7595333.1 thiamine diphosphokinase [Armatimonadota bacterium]